MPHSAKSVAVEVVFAQRLASNQPKTRDKSVKQLRKYLAARAGRAGGAGLAEDDLMKLWKGLHYCFWMSDKPLVQEELAENISSMVHVFQIMDDQQGFLPFVKCGLVTLGREWFGIDKWRMDKFMMFTRRLLRQAFAFCARRGWANAGALAGVFEESVVRANRNVATAKASLGFQLHFTDVYLEELAKVGGEELEHSVIRSLLQPFLAELREGKDERLRDHIEERIFHHLMRQSDVGIAYEQEDSDEEDELEEGDMEPNGDVSEEEDEEEMEEEDSEDEQAGSGEDDSGAAAAVRDPRAGRVDVTVPQLMVDYDRLAADLMEAGGDAGVGQVGRKVLYRLTKQFRALHEGRYPLSGELSDSDEEELPKVTTKKVRKRRAREDLEHLERVRQEAKEYRQALKNKKQGKPEPAVNGGQQKKGADSADGDGPKQAKGSPQARQKKPAAKDTPIEGSPKGSRNKKKKAATGQLVDDDGSDPGLAPPQSGKKKKSLPEKDETEKGSPARKPATPAKRKAPTTTSEKSTAAASPSPQPGGKKKRKRSVEVTPVAESGAANDGQGAMEEEGSPSPVKAKKKRRSLPGGPELTKENLKKVANKRRSLPGPAAAEEKEPKRPAKTATKKKVNQNGRPAQEERLPEVGLPGGFSPPKISSVAGSKVPTPVFVKKAKSKAAAAATPSPKSKAGATPGKRKRIGFSGNKYQSVMEHSRSIQESPDIPFVPERRPSKTLLKNRDDISVVHTPSPVPCLKEVKKNTKINSKSKTGAMLSRMTAAQFF